MDRHSEYENLFVGGEIPEPRSDLLDTVMLRINRERGRVLRTRILCFGTLSLFALAAFVPAWRELQGEVSRSGFSEFSSLLISDFSTALTYWKEFSFSLLESFPAIGIAAVLGALFAFLSSVRLLILNISGAASGRSSFSKTRVS